MWILKKNRLSIWVVYMKEKYHENFFMAESENFGPQRVSDSWLRTGKDMSPWTLAYGFPRALRIAPVIANEERSFVHVDFMEAKDW